MIIKCSNCQEEITDEHEWKEQTFGGHHNIWHTNKEDCNDENKTEIEVLITPKQLKNVFDVELSGLTHDHDYWCDVFIETAWIKEGETERELTEQELDYIQDHYTDWLYDEIISQLY